jgi:hypothetical protein
MMVPIKPPNARAGQLSFDRKSSKEFRVFSFSFLGPLFFFYTLVHIYKTREIFGSFSLNIFQCVVAVSSFFVDQKNSVDLTNSTL